MMVLTDNYDSFTFNLFHYLGGLGADVLVYRNDKISGDRTGFRGLRGARSGASPWQAPRDPTPARGHLSRPQCAVQGHALSFSRDRTSEFAGRAGGDRRD